MRTETLEQLYKNALEKAEAKKREYEEVEVVLVPVVLCKTEGKVQCITGVDHNVIIAEENQN